MFPFQNELEISAKVTNHKKNVLSFLSVRDFRQCIMWYWVGNVKAKKKWAKTFLFPKRKGGDTLET